MTPTFRPGLVIVRATLRCSLLVSVLALPAAAMAVTPDCEVETACPPEANSPTLPQHAATAAGFVPRGWKVEYKVTGNLHGAGKNDVVLVLRDTAQANVIDNPGWGGNPLDTNPRMLVVAFANANSSAGYDLVLVNYSLIGRHVQRHLSDPFGGVAVDRNGQSFTVSFGYNSVGRWDSTDSYTFRWQQGQFELIGYDHMQNGDDNLHLSSGISVNYSTGKLNTWLDMDGGKEQAVWREVAGLKRWTIDNMGDAMQFSPLQQQKKGDA